MSEVVGLVSKLGRRPGLGLQSTEGNSAPTSETHWLVSNTSTLRRNRWGRNCSWRTSGIGASVKHSTTELFPHISLSICLCPYHIISMAYHSYSYWRACLPLWFLGKAILPFCSAASPNLSSIIGLAGLWALWPPYGCSWAGGLFSLSQWVSFPHHHINKQTEWLTVHSNFLIIFLC